MHSVTTAPLWQHLCEVIPGGVNSGARAFIGLDQLPLIAEKAFGDTIVDVDGRSFLDFCGSWGPMLHGHAHPEVIEAVQKVMERGLSFGASTAIEEKLARKVIACVPSIEQVRFVNSGTEAAMSALRLSRGYTGRDLIVKFIGNYHGHVDALLVEAGSGAAYTGVSASSGVSAQMVRSTLALPFNDLEAVERCFKSQGENIAAVIVEPIAGNMGVVPATHEFLSLLRKKTEEVGAILIFDEVITGFRVAKGGAQELYKIQPDLTLLGKILGGGLPAAAFGGKRAMMEHLAPLGAVYQAGTLCGNPLAMAAGLKQLELLEEESFYQTLEQKSRRFLDPIAEKLGERGCVQRVGSMFTLFWGQQRVRNMAEAKACDFEQFKRAFHFFFNEGLYFPPSPLEAAFISTAHRESELDRAQHLLLQFLT